MLGARSAAGVSVLRGGGARSVSRTVRSIASGPHQDPAGSRFGLTTVFASRLRPQVSRPRISSGA